MLDSISADTVLLLVALAVALILLRGLLRGAGARVRGVPKAGSRCPSESNKVVFASRVDAQRSVQRSRKRWEAGRVRTPLDHEYRCPHHDHWHVSSKPRRR